MAPPSPKLRLAVPAMVKAAADFVVVGGFAVIANRFIRATQDINFLAPDDDENDRRILNALLSLGGVRERDEAALIEAHLLGASHLRSTTVAGTIDIIRGGPPPLDFDTVKARSMSATYEGVTFSVASLRSIVGFKRLADRPRDRNDLIGLEEIHGPLPIDPIPGLDT